MSVFCERGAILQFEPASGYGGNFDEREVLVQRLGAVPVRERIKELGKATRGKKGKQVEKERRHSQK